MITNETNKTLHICYITDEAYMGFTTASIYSIIRRKDPDTVIRFYVIGCNLNNNCFTQLRSFDAINNVDMILVNANYDKDKDPGYPYRLKMSLPMLNIFNGVKKLLYIDGDLFARKDISTVYHTDLDGYSIGMVKDAGGIISKGIDKWPQPKYFHRDFYFNTGLVLMDIDKLRKNDTCRKWMEYVKYVKEYGYLSDQIAINYVSHYDCKVLPPSYQLSYHNLIRYPEMHVHKVERWNQYYNTHYSSIKEMVDASYFWHFHENKSEMIRAYPFIAKIFSILFEDYNQFAKTGVVQPWQPTDDAPFYIDSINME